MKTPFLVCLTLLAAGLAASQLPRLVAQDDNVPRTSGTSSADTATDSPPVASESSSAIDVPSAGAATPAASAASAPSVPAVQVGPSAPNAAPRAMVPSVNMAVTAQGAPGPYYPPTAQVHSADGRVWTTGTVAGFPQRSLDPRVRELMEKYDQLEAEVMRLVTQYRGLDADSPEREELVKQVTKITEQQFDLRHEARKIEIDQLRKQVDELQNKLKKREDKREQIVQQRIEQLTNQKDELRWEPLEPASAMSYDPFGAVYGVPAQVPVPPGYRSPPTVSVPVQPYPPQSARDTMPPMPPPMPNVPTGQGSFPGRLPGGMTGAFPGGPVPTPVPPTVVGQTTDVFEKQALSVQEAKAKLDFAEKEYKRMKRQFEAGVIPASEFQRVEADWKMAQVAVEMAKQANALNVRMLELDVRRAQAALEAAKAELDAITAEAKSGGDTPALAATIRKAQANLTQMEVDVAKAEAMMQAALKRGGGEEDKPSEAERVPRR